MQFIRTIIWNTYQKCNFLIVELVCNCRKSLEFIVHKTFIYSFYYTPIKSPKHGSLAIKDYITANLIHSFHLIKHSLVFLKLSVWKCLFLLYFSPKGAAVSSTLEGFDGSHWDYWWRGISFLPIINQIIFKTKSEHENDDDASSDDMSFLDLLNLIHILYLFSMHIFAFFPTLYCNWCIPIYLGIN